MTDCALVASHSPATLATILISGCLAEGVLDALHHAAVRPGGRLALQDGHLAARAGAAFVDDALRFRLADADPVGADIDVRIVVRPHVDLDDVNSRLFGALQQLRVGLDVGIVNDENVRLFRDERGDRLRAGVRAEMRIADFELHAEPIGLFLHDRRPAFGEVDAHRDRHEGDRLAGECLEVVGAPRVVDAGGHARGPPYLSARAQTEGRRDMSHSHVSFSLLS